MDRFGVRLTGDWRVAVGHLGNLARVSFLGLHKQIGEYLVSDTAQRFKTGMGPKAPWPPSRRAREEHGRTLEDTRLLKRSIGYRAQPDRVDVGTNVKYARIHQFGGVIRPKRARVLLFRVGDRRVAARKVRIPPRPFLGINERNQREIGEIIRDAVRGTKP